MATKKVKYVEPRSYFTEGMLKAAKEYDKEQEAKAKAKKTEKKSK